VTNLFIVYLAALAVPTLFASWRCAVFGLGLQGLILSLVVLARHTIEPIVIVEFGCLLLIRGVFVPWYLLRKVNPGSAEREFSLVGSSLGARILVLLVLTLGLGVGSAMGKGDAREVIHFGTAVSALLVGMLMVANQGQPAAQLIGLFTFEGGVTLTELMSPHAAPFPVQLGIALLDLLFVLTVAQYLARFAELGSTPAAAKREGN
jgi:hydrogenase-4 membrane subunit HyfE